MSTKQPKIGQRFCVIGNSSSHNYTIKGRYRVVRVDTSDQTLIGADASGNEGNWIKWSDIKYDRDIGWEWLQQKLPPDAVDLLMAFDGLPELTLNEDVRNHIVLQTPDLREKILDAQVAIEREEMDSA